MALIKSDEDECTGPFFNKSVEKETVNMRHIYFEMQADDTQRAIDFYSELFGWKFTKAEGTPVPYWRIETVAGGGLQQRSAQRPPAACGTNAFCCSLEVDDFDGAAEKIVGMGGAVALPKFPVLATCWQRYFIDTEGNVFGDI